MPLRRGSLDSAWLLAALGLAAAAALAVQACHGDIGACSGRDCPKLPGCEAEAIVCDPEHVCMERVCEGIGWICGVTEVNEEDGTRRLDYSWHRKSAPCSDGEPCTVNDICLMGRCRGQLMDCSQPPPNACLDGTRLQAFLGAGGCTQGACAFPSQEIVCKQGCLDGKCVGEPCLGVTCKSPPGPCHQSPGRCVEGVCHYDLLPVGSACTPADACQNDGKCDEQGVCRGSPVSCQRPHAVGGTCVQGVCQGFACESGWGNCNGNWEDGCENPLDSVESCGKCGRRCEPKSHADPVCTGGSCGIKCQGKFQDCDGNIENGCEILVGVANSCNMAGLGGTAPCGTAYCGSASGSRVKNFGTWHCTFCEHCHHYSNGWAWCLGPWVSGGTGNFSDQRCPSCCSAESADKVCN
jgi:hypothetical protein